MSVKAIFSECSNPLWLDVVRRLIDENQWQICYWISAPDILEQIRTQFPQTIVHNVFDAVRVIPAEGCQNYDCAAIDEKLLKDLSEYELIIFNMMNRLDPDANFTYSERERHYHRLLKYWLSVLTHYKPDVVVFSSSPHILYDYILYILCKYKKIKTIIFAPTIEGYLCAVERFEDEIEPVVSLYKRLAASMKPAPASLSSNMEKYLEKVLSPYSVAMPYDAKEAIEKFGKRKNVKALMKKFVSLDKYVRFLYTVAPPNYLKQRNRAFEDSRMSYLEYIMICNFKARIKKRKLCAYYDKLAQEVPLDKPYIYVPLHYQPEKSTCPDGGVFVNQLLLIDLISKSIPKDWSVYVKEHIIQFSPCEVGERSRTKDFYSDIASLPNVKLVPRSLSPFDLIDKSQAVATITGTSGIEAVIRGKPVLCFGYAWYRGCEGVFYTPTLKSCQEAISKIRDGYKVDHQKVRLFFSCIEEACFIGYVEPVYGKIVNLRFEENLDLITRSIRDFYKHMANKN